MIEPEREKPDAERVTEALRDAGGKALAGIETARQKAGDMLAATRAKGEAVIEETREKTYRAAAETNRLFQEHPIAAVAAAAAAGAVIGIFMPRIALGAKAGQLARKAIKTAVTTEAAQAVWSTVRDAAGKAAASTPPRARAPRRLAAADIAPSDATPAEDKGND